MSDSAAPASAASTSSLWQCIAAASAFAASVLACTTIYLAYVASGPWLYAPATLHWSAHELSVTRGTAKLSADGLVITATDDNHTALVSLNTTFRASEYPVILWDAAGVPDDLEATLLWYSDIDSTRVFRHPLVIEGGRLAPVRLGQAPGWLGRIGGLALVLRGSFATPVVIRGATAKPMSATQVMGDRIGEWLRFEPWNGASINGLPAPVDSEALSLPASLAAIAVLAGAIYAGLLWWKRRSFDHAVLGGLGALFIVASVVADGRWQWNLMRQATLTRAQYGDKTFEGRHLAAEDGALFAFTERVRNKLPPPPARVFMAADVAYLRARGAYHLYPYNVYYDASSGALPPPDAVRSGDYLVVYQRHGVQYDAGERRLRWDGYSPVSVDLIITDAGAALFRVR